MTKVQELAAAMGVTEADVAGFVAALQVWMEKGLSFDEAIARHMAQMTRLVNSAAAVADRCKAEVAGAMWDSAHAA